ncbi:MAG TPA: hypothetical protein VGP80_09265 [Gemmatimonadales bacterium]|jgi:hypothetical protein|nr:hypothetical protein [Gemmatimonadales bacterium]
MATRDSALEIWSSAIDTFPLCGTTREKLEALIPFAIKAPSSHNSQPWLFRLVGDALELRADRGRRLPVVDPDDRELTISCGAALGCIEIALHNFGYQGAIGVVPPGEDPNLLARIQLGEPRDVTPMDRALFAAIPERRTHRLPFLPRAPNADVFTALETFGQQHGVWFRILQSESNELTLAELITEGDREQMANPAFREELAGWLTPNRSKSRDGMPGWTFGLGPVGSVSIPLIVRTFDTGDGRAAIDRDLVSRSSILAVVGTATDTPGDWVQTGRVLIQVLLRATVEGMAASFLNQPIEIPALRLRVAQMLGVSGCPQLILRMGYPTRQDRRTPRRDSTEVLEVSHGKPL